MSSKPEVTDEPTDTDDDSDDLVGVAGLGVLGAGRDDADRERTAERLEDAGSSTDAQQPSPEPMPSTEPGRNGHGADGLSAGGLSRRGALAALTGLGALGIGSGTASAGSGDHLGESWSGDPAANHGLRVEAQGGTQFGLRGIAAASDGRGILGRATSTTGSTRGVIGRADSHGDNAAALLGIATASSGRTYGFQGRSDSYEGRGALGLATASTGNTIGMEGRAASEDGTGVRGFAYGSSGTTFGVRGKANSPDGTGALGWANSSSGATTGVRGRVDSTTDGATAVEGEATAASGVTYGVHGTGSSPGTQGVVGSVASGSLPSILAGYPSGLWGYTDRSGADSDVIVSYGVYGESVATSGNSYGVYGYNNSSEGVGVEGQANSSTGETYGVNGVTNSSNSGAVGVRGYASGASGVKGEADTGTGVWGQTAADNRGGVFAYNTSSSGTTAGIYAINSSPDGAGVIAEASDSSGTALEARGMIDTWGDVEFSGGTRQRTAGPVAKGYVSSDTSTVNAVNVDSVTWDSSNTWYEITLTGITYDDTLYATMVTPRISAVAVETGYISGNLTVDFADDSQHDFSFVTHELPSGTKTTAAGAESSDTGGPVDELR